MQQAHGGGGNGNRSRPICRRCSTRSCASSSRPTTRRRAPRGDPRSRTARKNRSAGRDSRAGAAAGGAVASSSGSGQEQGAAERRGSEAPARTVDARSGRAAPAGRRAVEADAEASRGPNRPAVAAVSTGQSREPAARESRRERDAQCAPAICATRIRSRRARAARRPAKQLRGLEQQMQGARPDERRRAMGDLQLEARQLADAERRLGNEASRTAPGAAGEDARRRLAAEQERLADRTERLRRVGQATREPATAHRMSSRR